ncbi:anhydro-N-acetylmuramic acid kinase [Hirschia maritima]|uniref:anhydro-N-acetylmuramic acid kinase n=1 Tax=Hirschia maritima TaxID=1121961 RepID=UPI000361BEE5|nr:anhydro-N-acetylmuramic acid kinase [Hirschia maritima]
MSSDLAHLFKSGPQWVLGFMSGTSLDGVDVALIKTDGQIIEEFGSWITISYTDDQRKVLAVATQDALKWNWNGPEPKSFAKAERMMTLAHADAAKKLLQFGKGETPVLAGFHGQTVLHSPPENGNKGQTLQLGDGELLAKELKMPVVFDLRTADMEAGGHGAPLAPIYHTALLAKEAANRKQNEFTGVVLNLGGVANFTWQSNGGAPIAFDTGPGNGPIDEWVEKHGKGSFDENAQFAKAGQVDEGLIEKWMAHPYFSTSPPKSLDRYDFSAHKLVSNMSLEDGAATLTAFSARTILRALEEMPKMPEIVVATGGGRHNPLIMQYLRDELGDALIDAGEVGWRGDAIEAEAFAYLAARSAVGLPISFPETTGVAEPKTGGRFATPTRRK